MMWMMVASETCDAYGNCRTEISPVAAWAIVVGIAAVVWSYFWWRSHTDAGRAHRDRMRTAARARAAARPPETRLSALQHDRAAGAAASAVPAGLSCPRCGGTSFQAKRRMSTKIAFGALSLLGEPQWVSCVTCGARYRRG